jgi:glucokinase
MKSQSSDQALTPPLVAGVDVGGTKIAAAIVDKNGQIFGRVQISTDTSTPERTLRSVARCIRSAIDAAGITITDVAAAGLGIPGQVDPVVGVGILSVNLNWRDVPVTSTLETMLGLPCAIENDVRAAALGESYYGVGREARNMVYLSLGTGIAAGVVVAGRLYRGTTGMAGEVGHMIVAQHGPRCACGAQGCLEALAAGPAIAARARVAILDARPTVLRDVFAARHDLTSEDVCTAAAQGDKLARDLLDEVGSYLGYAIHLLVMAYDPEMIVLGGGVALAGDVLLATVREHAGRIASEAPVFQAMYRPEMLQLTALRRDVAILGAAALVAPAATGTSPQPKGDS